MDCIGDPQSACPRVAGDFELAGVRRPEGRADGVYGRDIARNSAGSETSFARPQRPEAFWNKTACLGTGHLCGFEMGQSGPVCRGRQLFECSAAARKASPWFSGTKAGPPFLSGLLPKPQGWGLSAGGELASVETAMGKSLLPAGAGGSPLGSVPVPPPGGVEASPPTRNAGASGSGFHGPGTGRGPP
jgi:hypothetical protein